MADHKSPNTLIDDLLKELAATFVARKPSADARQPQPPAPAEGADAAPRIRVDVTETPAAYTVQAEIAGVPKEDIAVSLEGGVVSLRAEVKRREQAEGERTLRSERVYGVAARSFELPQEIDASAAKARFDDGVLTLTLPKKQPAGGAQRLHID